MVSERYRSWAERRQIICSIIAENDVPPLSTFTLTESEEVFFRARAAKAVNRLAKETSSFKAYYALPTGKPFGYVLGIVALMVTGAMMAAIFLWLESEDATKAYPLFAACATVIVAAIGWAVAGWISHRNTVRQNTNNMLFARFSHAPFGEALHRFHKRFGYGLDQKVTKSEIDSLRKSEDDEDRKVAASVSYLLNYYELLSIGVISGDLDQSIIEKNVRGLFVFYHDKCEPYIRELNRINHLTYENLIKIRTHYREP